MGWLRNLFGSAPPSAQAKPTAHDDDLPTIEEMNRIIPAIGALMEKHAGLGLAVFDESLLPADKRRIEFVLFCAIGITNNEQQAQTLSAAMIHLADYQPNIGQHPVTLMPVLPDPNLMNTPEAIQAAANAFLSHSKTSAYARFEVQIQEDLARLKSLANKALTQRKARIAKSDRR